MLRIYRRVQGFLPPCFLGGSRAAMMASSNTFFRPETRIYHRFCFELYNFVEWKNYKAERFFQCLTLVRGVKLAYDRLIH